MELSMKFTERETHVMHWLSHGLTNKEIAQKLNISDHTVRDHVSSMLKKKKVKNRVALTTLTAKHEEIFTRRPD